MDKSKLKDKIIHEAYKLLFLAIYLCLFLSSLSIYRNLILNKDLFNFFHIGYNFVEALLLAKIILLGEMLHLGKKYSDKPLIIPTLYNAFIFTIFVFLFSIAEHFVLGIIERKEMILIWQELYTHALYQIMSKLLITFIFFILLFSFLETSRVIGEQKLFNLFFRRK